MNSYQLFNCVHALHRQADQGHKIHLLVVTNVCTGVSVEWKSLWESLWEHWKLRLHKLRITACTCSSRA